MRVQWMQIQTMHAWRCVTIGGVLLAGFGVCPSVAKAQIGLSSAPTMAKPVPSSKFVTYQPYACAVIAERIQKTSVANRRPAWYSQWPGTAATQAAADSAANVPVRAVTVADVRACLAPFTLETTAPNQLFGLAAALLSIDDDAKAEAVFNRVAENAVKAPMSERTALLRAIVRVFAGAKIPRLSAALRYMAQLDALGTVALGERVTAHNYLFLAGMRLDSLPIMKEHAETAVRLGHMIEGEEQLRRWIRPITVAAVNQANYFTRVGSPSEAEALLTQVQAELGPVDMQVVMNETRLELLVAKACQQQMSSVQASYVFMPGDTTLRTSIARPAKGKVSILVQVPDELNDKAVSNFELLRDVSAKYGDQVDITIMSQTTGWAPAPIGMKKIAGKDEAAKLRDFVQTYMKLPYPIAVWDRLSTGKVADGRLMFPQNPNTQEWMDLIIVDKKGQIRFVRARVPADDIPTFGAVEPGMEYRSYGGDRRWMTIVGELVREP